MYTGKSLCVWKFETACQIKSEIYKNCECVVFMWMHTCVCVCRRVCVWVCVCVHARVCMLASTRVCAMKYWFITVSRLFNDDSRSSWVLLSAPPCNSNSFIKWKIKDEEIVTKETPQRWWRVCGAEGGSPWNKRWRQNRKRRGRMEIATISRRLIPRAGCPNRS